MARLPSAGQLNLKQAVGQLLVVRTSGLLLDRQRLYPHWELTSAALEEAIGHYGVGGVLLFGGSLGDTSIKIEAMQRQAAVPLLVAADLEAGCGQHIGGATRLPTARAIGEANDLDLARRCGEITAREARAVGINWVLAPCLDLQSNPRNPVIALRAFAEKPEQVARLGTAFAAGLRSGGVLSAAKHFPGHGDVEVDSHLVLPVVDRERAQLEREDWLPFKAVLAAGIDSLITAHLRVLSLDPDRPATFSRRILSEIVRGEWGYEGLIVTDALTMGAVAGWPEPAVCALEAGADVILMPESVPVAVDQICAALRQGRLSEERLYASVARVLAAKAGLGAATAALVDLEGLDGPALERQIARRAIAVDRDRMGLLPLDRTCPVLQILVVDRALDGSVLPDSVLLDVELGFESYWLEADCPPAFLQFLVERAAVSGRILVQVLTPLRAYRGSAGVHGAAETFLRTVAGERTILASFGNPYLGRDFEALSTVVNAFNNSPASHAALLERLES
ncbi:glycoside hydrolase family 3 protein [Gloeobacter kilaueensis]|uniref:beta-N-acetylhexosaminidase n=1 Tax=Gloeobacter kilaueensis (strain ATCC BAA-2537 / CCAP 1431/1 / ULC 316 / JS1) TaxID=1183438 RepID=U5QJN1_GLOK1|nr:glycoside hydrolase family 3 N-terminal domain-containing protein [Gloeobacter kilaueensis]AGY57799.1 beta-N-acetylglucosaminidase [Gloeobacter kilaueensis JS1]